MSQRTLRGGDDRMSDEEGDDRCGAAVMAAMEAISDHCGADGVPRQLSNGMVTMVPKEEMEMLENMAPEEMTDEDVKMMMDESPWLDEWTDGICTSAGHSRGSEDYEECRLQFARDALE